MAPSKIYSKLYRMEIELVDKFVLIIARRNSGKSVLLKWLIQQKKKEFDKIFVISSTESVNHHYKDVVPPQCIFEKYSEGWVRKLIETCTRKKAEGEDKKVLLVLDDLISDTDFQHSKTLNLLATRGRHLGIGVCLISQHLKSIAPVCRINADMLLVSTMNQASIEILCDEYCAAGLTKQEFCTMINRNTKDYNFVVINNTSTRTNTTDEIFGVIRAPFEKEKVF